MENFGTLALVPVAALLIGAAVGLVVGLRERLSPLLWLIGAAAAVSLVLIIWLAAIGPGEEAGAFLPLATLTGAVFPALFGAIMGGVVGRALVGRRDKR